jgi:rare lipoprotein A
MFESRRRSGTLPLLITSRSDDSINAMRTRALVLSISIVLLFAACGKKRRATITPPPPAPAVQPGYTETGVASWYGHPYHGRASSSGEIYDMEKLTAAHRTMPFGTEVRVINLGNDRSVQVRINDRGPFVEGRIIDLSHAAASEIRMIGPGTAQVRLEVLSTPSQQPAGAYYAVQIGAFRDRTNAERQRVAMEQRFGTARLVRRDGKPVLWKVLVGHEAGEPGADALAARLRGELGNAFVVRVDAPINDLLD